MRPRARTPPPRLPSSRVGGSGGTLPPVVLPIGGVGPAGLESGGAAPGDGSDHYHYDNTRTAFLEVLWRRRRSNAPPNAERASVLTHGAAAVLWIAYAIGRTQLAPTDASLGATMHVASIATFALTYAMSTAFHIYKTVEVCAPWMRTLDFTGVYLGLAVNGLAVVAIAGDDGRDTPIETWVDPVLASFALFAFFFLRRALLEGEETYQPRKEAEGFRVWHTDLEHAALRQSGSLALAYMWVLMAPSAFLTLDGWLAVFWLCAILVSTVILTGGAMVLTDLLGRNQAMRCGPVNRPWCYMDPHAWWHILACASNAVMIAGREVILAYR
jgi:hypothetical protein